MSTGSLFSSVFTDCGGIWNKSFLAQHIKVHQGYAGRQVLDYSSAAAPAPAAADSIESRRRVFRNLLLYMYC